ncbi:MAG: vWA domain-containing protein [Acidimicrobiales bacterium]
MSPTGQPGVEGSGGQVERIAVAFVGSLRRAGLEVPVGSAVRYYEALGAVGLTSRDPVYWTGRATLVQHPELIDVYDHVFAAFWEGVDVFIEDAASPDEEEVMLAMDDEDSDGGEAEEADTDLPLITLRYSPHERLGEKDFAEYEDEELAEAYRLMERIVVVGGSRASRRRVATHHQRGHPDLRRTVRQALRTAGEPIERKFTTPGTRLRRVVFLLDISGSMETYARALARFVQAAVVGRRRVEVFTVGTRLTRVTRELTTRDPDRALARASDAVEDWSGGTRLGDSLRDFNDEWGQRGMARGATVVLLSDGWDRGEPAVMEEQMGRLARVAHEVIWVNPLKASPGYEPLAQGMAAALPHVDRFIEGHCLDSLEVLAELLAGDGSTAPALSTSRRAQ